MWREKWRVKVINEKTLQWSRQEGDKDLDRKGSRNY